MAWVLFTFGLGLVYFWPWPCLLVAWVMFTFGLGPVYCLCDGDDGGDGYGDDDDSDDDDDVDDDDDDGDDDDNDDDDDHDDDHDLDDDDNDEPEWHFKSSNTIVVNESKDFDFLSGAVFPQQNSCAIHGPDESMRAQQGGDTTIPRQRLGCYTVRRLWSL